MVRDKISLVAGITMLLALVSAAQPDGPREGSPPPTLVVSPAPQPPGGPGPMYQVILDTRPGPGSPVGPGPMPMMRMRELAEQLRARAREAQELSDRLRRQADELDQMAMRQMGRGPGLGPQQMEQAKLELGEIKEAIGRAEREGRRQEADELRRRAEQLRGGFQPMPPGARMEEPQGIKRQIERLREEAQRAKDQGRIEDSERTWKEADRMEQVLRGQGPQQPGPRGDERQEMKRKIEGLRNEAQKAKDQGRKEDADRLQKDVDRMEQQSRGQGPREKGEFGRPMPPEVQDILRSAEQAEREGRLDDARRQREKAEAVARQPQGPRGKRVFEQPGPRGDERQEIKRKIEDLRKEAQKAKDQGRREDADRLSKDADRLEQQLREQGPREKGEFGRPMPPEVQDILKSAEQAEREGRMDDARRQREKAEAVARPLQEQKKQGPNQRGPQLKDELIRGMEQIKQEIGRLWQAVNEMRNRPKEGKPA